MKKDQGYLARHRIARSSMKADLLYFGVPALLVFTAGLIVSGRDGYDGLTGTLLKLVIDSQSFHQLSIWNIAGLTIFVVGLTVAIVAACTLGRFYAGTVMIWDDHQLIRHGLYRYVRHPLYLGVLFGVQGVPVYAPSFYGFLLMSALVPIFLVRIKMEERLLTEEFGGAYREYQKTTAKLIPFIY